MSVEFKVLDVNDIPSFMDLVGELKQEQAGVSFTDINTADDIVELMENPQIYLYGAYLDAKLVGVFKATQGGKGREHSCYIASALTKSCRGQGIGNKLLNYSLDQLEREGIWMIRAYVYSNNTASFSSLLAAGFMWAGTVYKHKWDEKEGKYVDDLIFHKELKH